MTVTHTIKNYVSDQGKRLTEFPMTFSDGETKPAYLLSSVANLLGREYRSDNLEKIGLTYGVNFMVENTTDLPDGVPDTNILGAVNGKRTVVSLDGLIKLIMAERNAYGDQVRGWLSEIVVPKALRAYPTLTDHPVLITLRQDVNQMGQEIVEQAEVLGLPDIRETVAVATRKFHPAGPVLCGITGVVGTAYLVRHAYVVGGERIRKQEAENGKSLGLKEKTKLVWKLYIPAVATTVISTVFVIGTNR